jgi:hypothetical protein
MDLKKIHDQANDPEFIAKLDVAAVMVGSTNPRVWSIENAIAVAIEFDKKRSNSDETLLAAAQTVFDEVGDVQPGTI